MNVKVTNKCKRFYWPNPGNLTDRILQNVPEKLLSGLSEVIIIDRSDRPIMEYFAKSAVLEAAKIKIQMEPLAFCGVHSVIYFNIAFLQKISEHIKSHIQPTMNDAEISEGNFRVSPKWFYFGPYIHERVLMKLIDFLFDGVKPFRNWFNKWIIKIIGVNGKST